MPDVSACAHPDANGRFHLCDIGEDDPTITAKLALVYSEVGQHKQAITLLEPEVEIYRKKAPRDDRCTLRLMHLLSTSYSHVGRATNAL